MNRSSRCLLACFLAFWLLAGSGCAIVDRLSGEGEAQRIRAHGIPATARVLDIWDTGISVNDNPVVGFSLEVHPADGAPYAASTRGLVSRLHIPQIQPGAVLEVSIDPENRNRVALAIYRDR